MGKVVSQIRSGMIQSSASIAVRHPFSFPEKGPAQGAIEMFRLFTLYSYSDIPGLMSRGEAYLMMGSKSG